METIVQNLSESLLAQAESAALKGHWADVTDCLQPLLSQSEEPTPLSAGGESRVLALALQALAGGDFQIRWDLAKILPQLGEAAIAPLIQRLADPAADPEEQWFVIRILGQIPHPAVIPALINVLERATDAELHSMAITVLASLGEAAIAQLGELLNHPAQRPLAAQALAQIRHPATIPWFLTVVNDAQPTVRATAIATLGNFPDPRILPVLLTALADQAAPVRQAAVTALGFWASTDHPPGDRPDVVAQLHPLLGDQALAVAQQAAIALSRWGNASAIAALTGQLIAPSTPIPLALEIVRALSWIGQPSALQGLQQALQLSLPGPVQQEILLRLGRIEPPALQAQATQILVAVLQQPTGDESSRLMQQTIALSLGYLKQPAALNPLIDLLAVPDDSLRLHVIAALKSWDAPIAYQRLQQLATEEISDPDLCRGIAIALREWSR